MAPMVHWPEVMVTYDVDQRRRSSPPTPSARSARWTATSIADEVNFQTEWLDDARRYYTNIVGKYGTQVQALLKKAAAIDIRDASARCTARSGARTSAGSSTNTSSGATYTPEENAVVIAYASVYGNTETTPRTSSPRSWPTRGVRNVKVYDVSDDASRAMIVAECFRCEPPCLRSPQPTMPACFVTMEDAACTTSSPTTSRTAPSPSLKTAPGRRRRAA